MKYALTRDGQIERYPCGVADLARDYGTGFRTNEQAAASGPFTWTSNGEPVELMLEPVTPNPPSPSLIEHAVEGEPVRVEGELVEQWTVEPLPLEDSRLILWNEVKRLRNACIDAGATVPGVGVFDTTLESRLNISGAVTMAQIAMLNSVPFSQTWTLADNSVETIDGPTMIAIGLAVGQHVAACHANAQVLRAAIEGAEDHDALAGIDVEAGWP